MEVAGPNSESIGECVCKFHYPFDGPFELARRRTASEQLVNVVFEHADAQVHPFRDRYFDLAISRHGSMFFGDPPAAFTNIARALRPGGRLVLLTWQPFESNEFMHAVGTALAAGREVPRPPSDGPSPVALSDPDRVQSFLESAGFLDVRLKGLREPMYFGSKPDDAFGYLCGQHAALIGDLDPGTRRRALEDLHTSLTEHHTQHGVLYDSASWLIQARRNSTPTS